MCIRDSLGGGHAAARLEVIEGHYLRADEAALEVGVDLARRLGGLGALFDGPGAAFLLAVGQKADKAQQFIAGLDQLVPVSYTHLDVYKRQAYK